MLLMGSNAKHQAAYRSRQRDAGAKRLCLYIAHATALAIQQIAAREGLTQRELIERLVLAATDNQLQIETTTENQDEQQRAN